MNAAIYEALQQVGDVTIEELASLARCSKTAARRALRELNDSGCIGLTVRDRD